MIKLLIILFIFSFQLLAYAQHADNKIVSQLAYDQKDRELDQESFACYLIKRDPSVELLNRRHDKSTFIQEVAVDSKIYQLNITSSEKSFILKIYKGSKVIDQIQYTKEDLNFRKANVQIKSQIKVLNLIECFVGKKTFFYHHDDTRDFVIHNHVQKQYYGNDKSITQWYKRFTQNFKNYTNLVLMDGYAAGKNYKLNEKQLIGNQEVDAEIVTGKMKDAQYKISPTGNLFFNFSSNFTGDIYLLGTAYNYCFNNIFLSLGRALLSTQRNELQVHLPGYYIMYQNIGINKRMNIDHKTSFMDLATLIQTAPDEFDKLFKIQKKWIEQNLNGQVEVIRSDEQPQTNKPVLKLHFILP